MIERRGTFLKPVVPAARSIPVPEPVLSGEALRVAHEYVDYRLACGWTAADIMDDLELVFQPGWESLQTVVRAVAEHWQEEILPTSRAGDEAVHKRRMERRKPALTKARVLRGRVVRPVDSGETLRKVAHSASDENRAAGQ